MADTPTPTAQDWERLGMKWNGLFTELRCRHYDTGHVIDAGLNHNVGRERRTAWEVRLWDPHEGFVWGEFVDTEAEAFVLVTALVLLAAGVSVRRRAAVSAARPDVERARWGLWSFWVTVSLLTATQVDEPVVCACGIVGLVFGYGWLIGRGKP